MMSTYGGCPYFFLWDSVVGSKLNDLTTQDVVGDHVFVVQFLHGFGRGVVVLEPVEDCVPFVGVAVGGEDGVHEQGS